MESFKVWLESSSLECLKQGLNLLENKIQQQELKQQYEKIIRTVRHDVDVEWGGPEQKAEFERILPVLCDVDWTEINNEFDGKSERGYELEWNQIDLCISQINHDFDSEYDNEQVSTPDNMEDIAAELKLKFISLTQLGEIICIVIKNVSPKLKCIAEIWKHFCEHQERKRRQLEM